MLVPYPYSYRAREFRLMRDNYPLLRLCLAFWRLLLWPAQFPVHALAGLLAAAIFDDPALGLAGLAAGSYAWEIVETRLMRRAAERVRQAGADLRWRVLAGLHLALGAAFGAAAFYATLDGLDDGLAGFAQHPGVFLLTLPTFIVFYLLKGWLLAYSTLALAAAVAGGAFSALYSLKRRFSYLNP